MGTMIYVHLKNNGAKRRPTIDDEENLENRLNYREFISSGRRKEVMQNAVYTHHIIYRQSGNVYGRSFKRVSIGNCLVCIWGRKKSFVDEVIHGKLEPLRYHQLYKTKQNKKKKIMNPFSFKSSTFPLISYRPVYIGQTLHLLIVERRRENQMIICALGNYPFVR